MKRDKSITKAFIFAYGKCDMLLRNAIYLIANQMRYIILRIMRYTRFARMPWTKRIFEAQNLIHNIPTGIYRACQGIIADSGRNLYRRCIVLYEKNTASGVFYFCFFSNNEATRSDAMIWMLVLDCGLVMMNAFPRGLLMI